MLATSFRFRLLQWFVVLGGIVNFGMVLPVCADEVSPATACWTPEQLTKMCPAELEDIYRRASAGSVPVGGVRGWTIYRCEEPFAGVRSRMAGMVWRGKEFHECDATIVNVWSWGKAVKARVCMAESQLDGKPSIIMDYCGTSKLIWRDVRDEIREVSPGVYLGLMYRRRDLGEGPRVFFVLRACD